MLHGSDGIPGNHVGQLQQAAPAQHVLMPLAGLLSRLHSLNPAGMLGSTLLFVFVTARPAQHADLRWQAGAHGLGKAHGEPCVQLPCGQLMIKPAWHDDVLMVMAGLWHHQEAAGSHI